MELSRKGISAEDADAALGEVDEEAEQALARRVAERKAGSLTGVAPEVAMRRVAGQLARKGYGAGTSYGAASAAVLAAAEDRFEE